MRIFHLFKLASLNLVVLAALLLGLNLVSYVGVTVVRSRSHVSVTDDRWRLPIYDGRADRARLIFEEFRSLPSQYEPFVGWTRLPFQGRTTTIDRGGDRVHRAPPHTGESLGTVRFFGGSTMWGTGVEDQGTIPAIFNQMFPQYEVFNHGESGFTSRQALDRLINLYSHGARADIVVFLDGVNDVSYQCLSAFRPPTHGREQHIREAMRRNPDQENPAQEIVEGAYAAFFHWTVLATQGVARRLRLGGSCVENDLSLTPVTCATSTARADLVARVMVNNWEVARLITESRGGLFLGLLQPNAHIGSPDIAHLQGRLREDLRRNYRAAYPLIERLIRDRGVVWMRDISRALDGEVAVLIDDFHVTTAGNQILANRIRALLVENGWEPNQ